MTTPLNTHKEDIIKKLSLESFDDMEMCQGHGELPTITPGDVVDMSLSPKDSGFVSPDLEEGDQPLAVVFVRRKEKKDDKKDEDKKKSSKQTFNWKPVASAIDAGSEEPVLEAVKTCKSEKDWKTVIKKFKKNHKDSNDGDIFETLKKSDLTDKVEAALKENNIPFKPASSGDSSSSSSSSSSHGDDEEQVAAAVPGEQDDTICEECGNPNSQPFCGNSGKRHVAKQSSPMGQFSSDRACTQCGDGMLDEDAKQAVYVCLDCDGKFCEVCWDHEHRNRKRAHHAKYLLFYECDLCPFGNRESQAALWFCDTCRLLLCKQCWFNEHKNPRRRGHTKQFLYPGGESGEYHNATIGSQNVDCPSVPFDVTPYGTFIKTANDRICTICHSIDGHPGIYFCSQCDPINPEILCVNCWVTEHRMPHRRSHAKHLSLFPCDVCYDTEGRPAILMCPTCQLKLCSSCHDIEHRNPARQGHTGDPLYFDITDPDARTQLDMLESLSKALPIQRVTEPPEYPTPDLRGGAIYSHYDPSFAPSSALYSPPPHRIQTPDKNSVYYSPSRYDVPQQGYDSFPSDEPAALSPQQELDRFQHFRTRLSRFYHVYNPSKLPSVATCLKEYQGYEEDLMAALVRRYGPEPPEGV
eukprot:TRINITY_DN9182_c0_g1_i1.p1 TRINITY_DN9182_c0_g1~~TRINITY_DN9182_c0_g1_i1.p1  ORF type:complete len:664 (+),score=133.89 TRINITY_DN9182_c0_g1_i1:82-1992(+)